MSTNSEGAISEIYSLFISEWNSKTTALVGYIPEIRFYGVDAGTLPDESKFWIRISTQEVLSEQLTLSENVVSNGSRHYETTGLVFVQIFAPKRADSIVKIRKLAQLAKEVFRKRTNNVIFYNSSIKEAPSENGALRFNVNAEYVFGEIN